jgi:hypothetical protein
MISKKLKTYKTNVTSRDKKRSACQCNKSQLPDENKTKDSTTYNGRNRLNDTNQPRLVHEKVPDEIDVRSECNTCETIDLLRVITQIGSQ